MNSKFANAHHFVGINFSEADLHKLLHVLHKIPEELSDRELDATQNRESEAAVDAPAPADSVEDCPWFPTDDEFQAAEEEAWSEND